MAGGTRGAPVMTAAEVAAAAHARLTRGAPTTPIEEFTIDSRRVPAGALFGTYTSTQMIWLRPASMVKRGVSSSGTQISG